ATCSASQLSPCLGAI
nr:RecName: Full=Non-specific lipid-transfer protein; Short=LTP; Short=NsLTP; AltName: Full=7kDa lipid transfer protein; Short=7k-LTP; AltName: Full=Non-specific lipid-transfer protein 2; Short=LTP2; AltName: Allergen=Sola l 6 [Solanum lycopersicum]